MRSVGWRATPSATAEMRNGSVAEQVSRMAMATSSPLELVGSLRCGLAWWGVLAQQQAKAEWAFLSAHDMDAGRSEAGASSPGSAPAVSRNTASWAATTAVPPPQPFDLIAG